MTLRVHVTLKTAPGPSVHGSHLHHVASRTQTLHTPNRFYSINPGNKPDFFKKMYIGLSIFAVHLHGPQGAPTGFGWVGVNLTTPPSELEPV